MDIVRFKLQVSNPFVVIWASNLNPYRHRSGETLQLVNYLGRSGTQGLTDLCFKLLFALLSSYSARRSLIVCLGSCRFWPRKFRRGMTTHVMIAADGWLEIFHASQWKWSDRCWLWSLREHRILYKYRRISDTSTSCQQNASREFAALPVERIWELQGSGNKS